MDTRYNNALYADLIYGGLARFCVPVFVMISGALLLPRQQPTGVFTKKWLVKILVPFLFWNIPYIVYNLRKRMSHGETFTLFQSLSEGYSYFTQNTNSFHFWYIYMIAGVYLFIPIIGQWARKANEKELLYFLIIWFVALCIQLPALSFLRTSFDLYYFTGYLGFLILGYYLSVAQFNYSVWQAALIALTGYSATAGLTYYYSKQSNSFVHTYYDYLRPNIVILSVGVFLLVKKLNLDFFQSKVLAVISANISKHSYGIYLIHWLVILELNKYGIGFWLITPVLGIPITVACCLSVSFGCVWAMSKLPIVGKYVSG